MSREADDLRTLVSLVNRDIDAQFEAITGRSLDDVMLGLSAHSLPVGRTDLRAAITRIDSEEAKAMAAIEGAVYGEDRVAVYRALDGLSEAIRAAHSLPVGDDPERPTLREQGWRAAQSASDHARGYEAGKTAALAGHFDKCATCGHDRISHYDEGDCGENECEADCTAFLPVGDDSPSLDAERLARAMRWAGIASDPFPTIEDAARQVAGDYASSMLDRPSLEGEHR